MRWRIELACLAQSCLEVSPHRLFSLAQGESLSQSEKNQVRARRQSKAHGELIDHLLNLAVEVCFVGESHYPASFSSWAKAPQVLWYKGQPAWATRPGFATVGSRRGSAISREWMEWQLSEFIRSRSLFLVSGGARGIDQMAHRIAVRENVPTLALMPLGIKKRYPPDFYELETEIIRAGGGVVSAFHPDWPLHKANFVRRNQVIAAFGEVCLVVEARRRSGTLLTARAALDLGRPVGVLPCSPLEAQGLGGLDLLCDSEDTTLIRDSQDLQGLWDRALSPELWPLLGARSAHRPNSK